MNYADDANRVVAAQKEKKKKNEKITKNMYLTNSNQTHAHHETKILQTNRKRENQNFI